MTRTSLLSLSSLLILLTLTSCSNKEQEEAAARQERLEQQLAADKQHQEEVDKIKKSAEAYAVPEETKQQEETPAAEPEAPAEPETTKVTHFMFKNTECKCMTIRPCGVSLSKCSKGESYDCMHDVSTYTVEHTITKTDESDKEESCSDE